MMPRFYREAPVQSIWESSANVICLDVLRALERDPDALAPVLAEIELAHGANAHLDRTTGWFNDTASKRNQLEPIARRLTEKLALALQASLLVRHSPSYISDGFCASRLGGDWGQAFATLDAGVDFERILERSFGHSET